MTLSVGTRVSTCIEHRSGLTHACSHARIRPHHNAYLCADLPLCIQARIICPSLTRGFLERVKVLQSIQKAVIMQVCEYGPRTLWHLQGVPAAEPSAFRILEAHILNLDAQPLHIVYSSVTMQCLDLQRYASAPFEGRAAAPSSRWADHIHRLDTRWAESGVQGWYRG